MGKEIKINIRSGFDNSGVSDASRALDRMAKDLEKSNKWLLQCNAELSEAIHKNASSVAVDYSAAADKAAKAMGNSYRSLADFLNDVKRESREASEKIQAVRAKIQAAAQAAREAQAEKTMRGFGKGAEASTTGVRGLTAAIKLLTAHTGYFGKSIVEIFRGGLWGAGAAAIMGVFNLIKNQYQKMKEEIENLNKKNLEMIESITKALESYKNGIAEAANADRDAAEKGLKSKQGEIELTERLTKATIELAKQKRIAAGEDAEKVNAESETQSTNASAKAAREKSDARINAVYRRIDIATKERDDALEEMDRLRNAKREMAYAEEFSDPKQEAAQRKLLRTLDRKILEARRTAARADKQIAEDTQSLEDEKLSRSALDMEIEAAEIKRSNDKKKREEDAAKAAAKAAEDAAAKAAAEREKAMQAETAARIKAEEAVHAKRMELLRQASEASKSRAAGFLSDFQNGGSGIAAERKKATDAEKMKQIADSFRWHGTTTQLTNALKSGNIEEYESVLAWNRKRRGASFTPEVEAAVRGVAEMRAGDATENQLKEIGSDVKGLRDDIKELLSMK